MDVSRDSIPTNSAAIGPSSSANDIESPSASTSTSEQELGTRQRQRPEYNNPSSQRSIRRENLGALTMMQEDDTTTTADNSNAHNGDDDDSILFGDDEDNDNDDDDVNILLTMAAAAIANSNTHNNLPEQGGGENSSQEGTMHNIDTTDTDNTDNATDTDNNNIMMQQPMQQQRQPSDNTSSTHDNDDNVPIPMEMMMMKEPSPPPLLPAPSVPSSNEILVNEFLSFNNKWTAYESTLEHLENPNRLLEGRMNHYAAAAAADADTKEPSSMTKEWIGPNLSNCDGGEGIVSPIDVIQTLHHQQQQKKQKHTTGEEKMQSSSSTSSSSSSENALPPSLEILSEILFQPGMKYRGHITIPGLGMQNNNNNGASFENNDEDGSSSDYDDVVEMNDTNDNDHGLDGEDFGNDDDVFVRSSDGGHSHASQMKTKTTAPTSVGKAYELVVIERGTDGLMHPFILAMHRCYGDEQAVHIQMNIVRDDDDDNDTTMDNEKDGGGSELKHTNNGTKKRLEIEYADGETVCKGRWVPNKFRFEGNVHQRLQVNDGIFHTSNAVTHVFTLYPCTDCFPTGRGGGMDEDTCLVEMNNNMTNSVLSPFEEDILSRKTRAYAAHRHRTHNGLVEMLQHYNKLYQHMDITGRDMRQLHYYCEHDDGLDAISEGSFLENLNEKQQLLLKLRHDVHWEKLFAESRMLGERLCAEFRRRVSLLDHMSFETRDDRVRFAERWKDARMDLAATHKEWDEWASIIKNVSLGAFIFDSYGMEKSMATAAIRHRLMVNFQCLEIAYQRASVRLPRRDLAKYEISCTRLHEEFDGTCIICQSPLLDVDDVEVKVYRLPCYHCFHEQCLQQWLHNHSSCPVCRFDLVEDAEQGYKK
eukprot:CAMPEP_0201666452 /NCGR_PEP_ID=MMETSP0494-20130426/8062_1 /ASSEMBLY_ACC=CAM_ASM_000839 /TAXON_ID=420259 /ORGANISM="Thalassiosira gravida, Strain GMp14c1" /LENGTH=870 /DNA_ID=CAMNT_0048145693 /DNA_START=62 /DNA_END=2674 /DNA_ORIENTATION=+